MYTGEMKLDQSCVQDILVAADMIQLKEVRENCTVVIKPAWKFLSWYEILESGHYLISYKMYFLTI